MARTKLLLASLTFILAACASTPELTQEQAAALKKIGVVSVLGDNVLRTHQGFMIFLRRETPITVPDWGLNTLATETAIASLKKAGKSAVAIGTSATANQLFADETKRALNNAVVKAQFESRVVQEQLDALVLLLPGACRSPVPNQERGVSGPAGVFSEGGDDVVGTIVPYACYTAFLVDAKSFATLDRYTSSMRSPQGFWAPPSDLQFGRKNPMSDKIWLQHIKSIAPEYSDLIRSEVKRLFEVSVPHTLSEIKVGAQ